MFWKLEQAGKLDTKGVIEKNKDMHKSHLQTRKNNGKARIIRLMLDDNILNQEDQYETPSIPRKCFKRKRYRKR